MRRLTGVIAVLGLVLGATGQAGAVAVPIVNSGFELPLQTDGMFTLTPNTAVGWLHDAGAGVWNPSAAQAYSGNAPEGQNVAYSNGASLSQTLLTLFAANTTYTLTAQVGHRGDAAFPGYRVQLLEDAVVLAECVTCVTPSANSFSLSTVTFTSGPSVPTALLGIRLVSSDTQTDFDDIKLDASPAPVPEPGTLFLIGAGLAGLGVIGRRSWFKGADD